MLSPVWIVGFSGHRHVPDRDGAARALEVLFQRLAERIKAAGGTPALCTSPAAGADLLALAAAEKAGFSIHLVLPLPVNEFRHDFQDPAEWSIASGWIDKATSGIDGGTIRTPGAILPRPECYYESGLDIVSASDVLVVYWDGEPANGLGGTSDVVDLARSQGKPVLRIDTRSQPDTAGDASPLTGLTASWPESDPVIERLNRLIREENVSANANAGEIQDLFDSIADRRAPQFRRGVARAIWIHALAALIGAVPSLFYFAIVPKSAVPCEENLEQWGKLAQAFTAVELVLVLAALVVTLLLYWGKTQQRWLMTRFAAELVRGLRAARPWLNPLNPQVDRHLPAWRRFAITVSLRACPDALLNQTLEERKQHYLTKRISHQSEHYREKSESAEHAHHRWHTLAKWAAILAPFAVTFALADKMFHLELTNSWWGAFCGKFLPVALPLTAASATAMRNALDLTRRATRYPEMVQRLAASEMALASAKTELSASQVVSRTEEVLLDELIEWNLAASNAGAH